MLATTTAYRTQMGLMDCYQSGHRYRKTPRNSADSKHFRHFGTDSHCIKDCVLIDPCCGSGHVLVYAFDIFFKMYLEEGYSPDMIPSIILENNLYGLDVDKRAIQLTSFALTMKARSYNKNCLMIVIISQCN